MGWLFGKREKAPEAKPVLASAAPRDTDRLGPAPPPSRSATPPGVSVHRFSAGAVEPLPPGGPRRSFSTHLVALRGGESRRFDGDAFGILLVGGLTTGSGLSLAPTDVTIGPRTLAGDGIALVESLTTSPGPAELRIRHDETRGAGIPGIAGIRLLHRGGHGSVLRIGPPPGARWVMVGLRSLAVFSGKLVLVDGEEPLEVVAGQVAVIADPAATLYAQAGNDSAFAIGLAEPDPVVALG